VAMRLNADKIEDLIKLNTTFKISMTIQSH